MPDEPNLENQELEAGGEVFESNEQGAEPTEPAERAPAQPQDVRLSPESVEAIAQKFAPVQEAQPALTQEELRKMLNVFSVTPEHVSSMGLQPEAIETLQAIVDGAVRQAVTMSHYQQQLLQQELQRRYAPMEQYAQQAQEREYRAQFYERNPNFKGYEPVCELVWGRLNQEIANGTRQPFRTVDDAFDAIAKGVDAILAKLPGGNGSNKTVGSIARRATSAKMSTLSGGGQGGASREAVNAAKSLAEQLFG